MKTLQYMLSLSLFDYTDDVMAARDRPRFFGYLREFAYCGRRITTDPLQASALEKLRGAMLIEVLRPADNCVGDEVRPLLHHCVTQVFEFHKCDSCWMILF